VERLDELSYLTKSVEQLDITIEMILSSSQIDACYKSKKKSTFILFINNRFVDSKDLKTTVGSLY
jgi:DNA mismatch repair ATPase MutL